MVLFVIKTETKAKSFSRVFIRLTLVPICSGLNVVHG